MTKRAPTRAIALHSPLDQWRRGTAHASLRQSAMERHQVQQRSRHHHGGLGAEGSEFEVRLPLVDPPPPTTRPPPFSANSGRKILIVEDNEDAAEMLSALLRYRGHHVTCAEDGQQALDTLRSDSFDVVFCDLGLPKMTGLEVAAAIRNDGSLTATALVALTGYGQPADKERTRDAGFDHHLIKPVELTASEELLSGLSRSQA